MACIRVLSFVFVREDLVSVPKCISDDVVMAKSDFWLLVCFFFDLVRLVVVRLCGLGTIHCGSFSVDCWQVVIIDVEPAEQQFILIGRKGSF